MRFIDICLCMCAVSGCNAVLGIERYDPCADADGDGSSTCVPDCDDGDPNNAPGRPEVCGDGRDNDCDGEPDQYCQGLGTFVAQEVGDDANPGTMDAPVATVTRAIENAQQIGYGVDVFVATGSYLEKIALIEGVSIIGGFLCDASDCSWMRDIELAYTSIDAIDGKGMLADATITRDTVLDGLVMNGVCDLSTTDSNALTIEGGAPTLKKCDITGGYLVTPCEASRAIAVSASNGEGPLIDDTTVYGGDCTDGTVVAIELDAGGVAEIRGGSIYGGTGHLTPAIVVGDASRLTMIGSEVDSGDCSPLGAAAGESFAVSVTAGGEAHIDRSRLNLGGNEACATCGTIMPAADPWCGGVRAHDAAGVTLTNSVAFGGLGSRSAAVRIAAGGASEIVLNANVLTGGPVGPPTTTDGLDRAALVIEALGGERVFGRVRNNVLRTVGTMGTGYGVYAEGGSGAHPLLEVLSHNAIFDVDAAYRDSDGSVIGTVADLTALPFASNNFEGICAFDPDFHLLAGSPCIDRGTPEEAPDHDLDGDPRPQGAAVDVGADEAQ